MNIILKIAVIIVGVSVVSNSNGMLLLNDQCNQAGRRETKLHTLVEKDKFEKAMSFLKDDYEENKAKCSTWVGVSPDLFLYGLAVRVKDKNGDTPFHLLMRSEIATMEHITFFIKYGACVDKKNDDEESPYAAGFAWQGLTPEVFSSTSTPAEFKREMLYNGDSSVINQLHSMLLVAKLEAVAKELERSTETV